jgi:hypothetical protein
MSNSACPRYMGIWCIDEASLCYVLWGEVGLSLDRCKGASTLNLYRQALREYYIADLAMAQATGDLDGTEEAGLKWQAAKARLDSIRAYTKLLALDYQRLFIDVDDTLVLYKDEGDIHPYGVLTGERFDWNTNLIERIIQFQTAYSDVEVIIWSGGGEEYAKFVCSEQLAQCEVSYKSKDPSILKPGDIVIDDDESVLKAAAQRGAFIYKPHDWGR